MLEGIGFRNGKKIRDWNLKYFSGDKQAYRPEIASAANKQMKQESAKIINRIILGD